MNGIAWLDSLASEASFTPQDRTLDAMRALLAALGYPQRSFRPIHITGTAGKGSTAEFITQILVAAGIRVGTYGSPHVYRINERIRINGEEIFDEQLEAALKTVHLRSVQFQLEPRWFEALTAAAFLIFRDEKVPWAVVGVGLGGRLDTTNVFGHPAITLITSIGLDHQAFLGTTEAQIARDKAGIFRPGVPAVIGHVSEEAHAAIAAAAARIGAPLVDIVDLKIELPTEPSLTGPHQHRNAELAVAAFSVLSSSSRIALSESDIKDPVDATQRHGSRIKSGMKITEQAISAGIQAAHLPGRFEILSKDPLVIFDVAHNPMKITALVETIEKIFHTRCGRFTTVVGVKKDKNAAAMLRLLDRVTNRYIFVDLPVVGHWSPADLARLTTKPSSTGLNWDRTSPLLITGSFYLAQTVHTLSL